MKVILRQTVPNLGKADQIVTVKDGYARNYLFPRGLATVADRSQIKALEIRNTRLADKIAANKAQAEDLKTKIEGTEVRLEGKVGKDSGKLFGAITAQDIADALKKATGVTVEKKQVGLLEPIKRLGTQRLSIDLHRDVDAHITVVVFDPEAPVEAPAATEVAATDDVAAEPDAEAVEA